MAVSSNSRVFPPGLPVAVFPRATTSFVILVPSADAPCRGHPVRSVVADQTHTAQSPLRAIRARANQPPFGDFRPCDTPSLLQCYATGTKPVKVAARGPLLLPVVRFFLVSHTPLHGPFTGLTPFLSKGHSGPSYTSRRLFRRHHLRLQPGPCGPSSNASLGISKDRPSVVRCRRVHSRDDIAAGASDETEPPFHLVPPSRFSTALTVFSSPTLHVFATCCQPWGSWCFEQLAKLSPHQTVPPFEVFSPLPATPPPLSR
jgi:hypothetical protein